MSKRTSMPCCLLPRRISSLWIVASWTSSIPSPPPPHDPRQPQTVITLQNSRRLFKPTSDCMARSPTQRLVAPYLPVGPRRFSLPPPPHDPRKPQIFITLRNSRQISKRTSDDMPSNVQTYLDAMLSSPAAHLVKRFHDKLFEFSPRVSPLSSIG